MTEAEFEERLACIVNQMQEIFEKDREVVHITFLVNKGVGSITVVPFAEFERVAHEKGHFDSDHCKKIVFDYVAHMVAETKAVGYIDVSEAWMLSPPEGSSESPEDFYERIGPIRKNPGRLEVVIIHAFFGRTVYMKSWKIRRRDKEAWLEPHLDTKAETDPKMEVELAGTNMGRIDLEVMKNAETATSG